MWAKEGLTVFLLWNIYFIQAEFIVQESRWQYYIFFATFLSQTSPLLLVSTGIQFIYVETADNMDMSNEEQLVKKKKSD